MATTAEIKQQRTIRYHGKHENYVYVLRPFIKNNKKYPSGYYTDNNKFYRNVMFTNQKSIFYCKNCKHKFYVTHMDTKIICPNCYHDVNVDKIDTVVKQKNRNSFGLLFGSILLSVMSILMLLSVLLYNYLFYTIDLPSRFDTSPNFSVSSTVKNEKTEVYSEELNRTVKITGYNSYYDPQSDCYFKFDTQAIPSQWYYFYNDISNKYRHSMENKENLGWMSYNNYNHYWTIKTGDKCWEKLDSDETSKLWHFENSYKNILEEGE